MAYGHKVPTCNPLRISSTQHWWLSVPKVTIYYPGNKPIYAKSLYTFEKSRTIQLNKRWNVHILGFLEFMIKKQYLKCYLSFTFIWL